jgi:hypothetical protein
MKKYLMSLFVIGQSIFISLSYAVQKDQSLATLAGSIMEPITLFSNLINTACYLLGGSFIFASLIKYLEHKRSPLMVPISTVVFLLIAGIVLIFLPMLEFIIQ